MPLVFQNAQNARLHVAVCSHQFAVWRALISLCNSVSGSGAAHPLSGIAVFYGLGHNSSLSSATYHVNHDAAMRKQPQ
jgi:hypothetical protein